MTKCSRLRVLGALAVVGLAACETATEVPQEVQPAFSEVGATDFTPTYLVAGVANQGLPANLDRLVAAAGGEIVSTIPQIGVAVVASDNPDFASTLSGAKGIQAVAPDFPAELPDAPSVDGLSDHGGAPGAAVFDFLTWGIDVVGAPAAWAAGNTGAGVRVAVLDAGIDHDHPDLAPNINASLAASFVPCAYGPNCDGPWEDWRITPGFGFNHGTHVSGTIAGAGTVGVHGVAPDAEIVPVKVCTEYFNACFSSSIISGLVYAGDIGADLVNFSIGGIRVMSNDWVPYCKSLGYPASFCGKLARYYTTGQANYVHNAILIYKRAFEYAEKKGTTVIVAAGNNAMDADHNKDYRLFAADFPHTIAVSALGPVGWCEDASTDPDQLAYYSNYGRSIIDVAAPGGNFYGRFIGVTDPCTMGFLTVTAYVFDGVLSTINGGWGWAQGTSMAAPHATGVAALLIAANGGSMNPAQVERALKAAAVDLGQPGTDPIFGKGRVFAGY